jgi:hypothetical protein
MSFVRLPRLEVVTYGKQIEACLVGSDSKFEEFGHLELFVR